MVIKNGRVVDPYNRIDQRMDIRVEQGRIAEVGEALSGQTAEELVIDATGLVVMPGAIDLHVHLREPGQTHKEDILTGAAGAAKGGVTTICAMPNTVPVIDSRQLAEDNWQKAKQAAVNVLQIGAITKGQLGVELADIEGMKQAHICGLSEDGRSVMNSLIFQKGLEQAYKYDLPVFSHCEDENLATGCMNQGAVSAKLGLAGISNAAEDIIAARDIILAHAVGARLHLCHVSTRQSVAILEFAKQQAVQVSAEVCPHHFSLTEQEVDGSNSNYKMNPPLRTEADRQALIKGLVMGVIDCIASDHAPHQRAEKELDFAKAANGIIGLETLLPISITELVKPGILSISQLVEKVSLNPAKILRLDKGHLSKGAVADITILDLERPYVYQATEIVSKSKNTPFINKKLYGRIVKTIVAGQIVYQAND